MRSTGVARGGKLAEQLAYSGSIRYGKRGSRGIGGMALLLLRSRRNTP